MSIAAAVAAVFVSVLFLLVRSAEHPVAAAGIALQTLAGFFATVQLWANSPSDSLLEWCARQVEKKRWRVAGLLDGRLRSLVVAAVWYQLASIALDFSGRWDMPAAVEWPIVICLLLLLLTGGVVLLFSLAMYGAVQLTGSGGAPRGKALIALRAQLRNSEWPWPLVGVGFLAGGLLQIAAA
jgi:hypothetical protein